MGAQFERFLEKYISAWYIPEIKVVDIIEIIIISVLVYEIMVWIKYKSMDAVEGNACTLCIHSCRCNF